MKRIIYMTAGLLCCALSSPNVYAVDIESNAGSEITIEVATPGASAIKFTPSTNVNMLGNSEATSFAVTAWHTQAVDKTSGQAYGMTSDSNKMFFLDISDGDNGTAPPTEIGTNEDAFADWTTM